MISNSKAVFFLEVSEIVNTLQTNFIFKQTIKIFINSEVLCLDFMTESFNQTLLLSKGFDMQYILLIFPSKIFY